MYHMATPTERRGDKFCVPNLGPLSKWALHALLRSLSGSRPTMRSRSPRALAAGEASSWAEIADRQPGKQRDAEVTKPTTSEDLAATASEVRPKCARRL